MEKNRGCKYCLWHTTIAEGRYDLCIHPSNLKCEEKFNSITGIYIDSKTNKLCDVINKDGNCKHFYWCRPLALFKKSKRLKLSDKWFDIMEEQNAKK